MTVFALILFALTYVLMFAFQKIRPYVALTSAVIFVAVGSLGLFPDFHYTVAEAVGQIDWNVLLMIAGTMGTVYLFIESGMPQLMSDVLVSHIHSVEWLVVLLSLFAGLISAFVDNVATVLMVAPVALALCAKIGISPAPAIICIAISSNLQGAATLVGDTTSILLSKAAGLDFMDFFFVEGKPGMFWVTEAGAVATALIIMWMFRKEKDPVSVHDRTPVEDKVPTALLVLTVLTLIAASFIPYEDAAAPGQLYKPAITNGIICMSYFVIGIVRSMVKTKSTDTLKAALQEIDYYTILLLAGLFVVIGGISEAGIIDMLGQALAGISGDGSRMSVFIVYTVIVWMSVLCSAFIDNIPYTATMLPVVAVVTEHLSAAGGIAIHPNLLYFGLLVGATLGGNITPIGASANITGLGILRKEGIEVKAGQFMKYSVPFTLTAVITGYVLVWLIWM
ncbi:MAG: arsenic transporter [Ruminococcaceae bacterium]|nr:arsenic transporter [Oscillospiraceae bacterium]